ncbi:glycoside hydrolase family 71/99-like protein [Stigmatella sp. ncwal1]|uniref:Glycoside hydrolase family 71/99-like protein n=1 Tax=Stigmatella ashevillensis TaxID=2995309 RepID=A0ABT5DMY7_9BACT|nr:glycoside hydrolase family 71/99-like protein [Stigmatella ashevillena]MDC0714964.1 glycoside hydrolase family 71/99-like protein [Stigmatella ashevillena]
MTRHRFMNEGASVFAALLLAGCGSASTEPESQPGAEGPTATLTAPVSVPKTFTKKVYAHVMPWFESNASSGNGSWGIHWTMANKNPNVIDGSGKRQIASYYYPLIGPYASGDKDVVEYQLLLMKYAGIDGVLIDWPGTLNCLDYPKNKQNAEAMINKTAAVGLEFAVVYEDNNFTLAPQSGCPVPDKLGAARNDMVFLRDNYFSRSNHIKVNNAPLLLDFGPQTFSSPSDWTNIFSPLSTKPTFLTLWYESGEAGSNAKGEYPWIYSDFTTGLQNFYNNRPLGVKFGVAYPGFNTFYTDGGWGGPGWSLPHNGTGTLGQTLDLAKNSGVNWIQLATWNDYGEGTMIEPTREFGYGALTTLQQKLGVPYGQSQLELIAKLYEQRKQYANDSAKQAQLNTAFNHFVNLQPDQAAAILNGGTTPPTNNPSVTNAGFESGMSGWNTWSPNGTAGAAFTETYNGGYNSANHLTHYSPGAFETWTYQTVNGIANGNYRVRAWVRKGGDFGFSRLQAKTCASCSPAATNLGTYSNWTQLETPTIAVTAGYLEFGLHTQAFSGSSFVHLDDVQIIRQ